MPLTFLLQLSTTGERWLKDQLGFFLLFLNPCEFKGDLIISIHFVFSRRRKFMIDGREKKTSSVVEFEVQIFSLTQ